MLTLALDTALDRAAVAVSDGAGRQHALVERMDRGHAEHLLPMIDRLLAEAGVAIADVGRIAVDVGPGSFTGIRIAVATARGLGLALGVPVIGVDPRYGVASCATRAPSTDLPARPTVC